MSDKTPESLKRLYAGMAAHTLPECKRCPVPLSCCSLEYCEMAEQYARERDVKLRRTDHPKLPFMGPEGCVVPPHLRPLCTMHTCAINSLGTSGRPEWDETYFELREAVCLEENGPS